MYRVKCKKSYRYIGHTICRQQKWEKHETRNVRDMRNYQNAVYQSV